MKMGRWDLAQAAQKTISVVGNLVHQEHRIYATVSVLPDQLLVLLS